eukprot:3218844-Prymnesium_polylepis.1
MHFKLPGRTWTPLERFHCAFTTLVACGRSIQSSRITTLLHSSKRAQALIPAVRGCTHAASPWSVCLAGLVQGQATIRGDDGGVAALASVAQGTVRIAGHKASIRLPLAGTERRSAGIGTADAGRGVRHRECPASLAGRQSSLDPAPLSPFPGPLQPRVHVPFPVPDRARSRGLLLPQTAHMSRLPLPPTQHA